MEQTALSLVSLNTQIRSKTVSDVIPFYFTKVEHLLVFIVTVNDEAGGGSRRMSHRRRGKGGSGEINKGIDRVMMKRLCIT